MITFVPCPDGLNVFHAENDLRTGDLLQKNNHRFLDIENL
jgi:hypothetical protein